MLTRHKASSRLRLMKFLKLSIVILGCIVLFMSTLSIFYASRVSQQFQQHSQDRFNDLCASLDEKWLGYENMLYILGNQESVAYLSMLSNISWSYAEYEQIRNLSKTISQIKILTSQLSDICVFFPSIDLAVNTEGSWRTDVFLRSLYVNSDFSKENILASDIGISVVSTTRYMLYIYSASRFSVILVLNNVRLENDLRGLFPQENDNITVWLDEKEILSNGADAVSNAICVEANSRLTDFRYTAAFTPDSSVRERSLIVGFGLGSALFLIALVLWLLLRLKSNLYDPIDKMLACLPERQPQGKTDEFLLISSELENLRSDNEQLRESIRTEREEHTIHHLLSGPETLAPYPDDLEYCVATILYADRAGTPLCAQAVRSAILRHIDGRVLQTGLSVPQEPPFLTPDLLLYETVPEPSLSNAVCEFTRDSFLLIGVSARHRGRGELEAACRESLKALDTAPLDMDQPMMLKPVQFYIPDESVKLPLTLSERTLLVNKMITGDRGGASETIMDFLRRDADTLGAYRKRCLEGFDILTAVLSGRDAPFTEKKEPLSSFLAHADFDDWITRIYDPVLLRNTLLSSCDTAIRRRFEMRSNLNAEILRYIDEHLNEDLSLQSLADYVGFSYAYMGQYFKTQLGLDSGFLEYVQGRRVNVAQKLLETTNMEISQITLQAGFGTINTFYKTFRKYTGKTPGEFRESAKRKINY